MGGYFVNNCFGGGGGGRLLNRLKSVVVGVFSGMYCIHKYSVNDNHIVSALKMTSKL